MLTSTDIMLLLLPLRLLPELFDSRRRSILPPFGAEATTTTSSTSTAAAPGHGVVDALRHTTTASTVARLPPPRQAAGETKKLLRGLVLGHLVLKPAPLLHEAAVAGVHPVVAV